MDKGWGIQWIKIKNFKFVRNEFTLQCNGRNVLLFGENGTGKSTLYWSLYTIFQSHLKTEAEVKKYFTAGHPQNLRNRFSKPEEDSYIKIAFSNGHGVVDEYTISQDDCFIFDSLHRKFMEETAFGSDFLNYKFLASLFDFDNSAANEIFPILKKHILPFLELPKSRKNEDGTDSGDKNAANWLKWLEENGPRLPRNKKKKYVSRKSEEYIHYKDSLESFNSGLLETIREIILETNNQLQKRFDIHVKIHPKFTAAGIDLKENGRFTPPSLLLHAEMTDANVKDRSHIEHPKSFFNEAKITSMALALRMAILNRRAPLDRAGSALFIDDMLISLDMSLRRKVLPMILEQCALHQLFIFTHDRSVFNMAIQIIKRRQGRKKDDGTPDDYGDFEKNWVALELFEKRTPDGPEPTLLQKKDHLERAKGHLDRFRIPECANALRQCCEAKIRELLPSNLLYDVDKEGNLIDPKLSQLIQKFEKEREKKNFPDVFPSIDHDRERILNPFSHDDIETPYYMNELQTAFKTMEELSSIRRKLIIPLDHVGDAERKYSLHFTKTTEDGSTHFAKAVFYFKESLDAWTYKGDSYPGSPLVKVVEADEDSREGKVKKTKGQTLPLNQLYTKLIHSVSLNRGSAPSLLSSIKT